MIQTSNSSISYVGNNSTTTPYPVPFLFHRDEDLVVVVRTNEGVETLQTLGTHYTVTGKGDPDGGQIVMTWMVSSASQVSIARSVPYTQLTSYEEADAFPAKSHEAALDKLTMEVQQLARGMGVGEDGLGTAFRVTDASGGLNAVSRINDSSLGVGPVGQAVLRTPTEMLAWLGQVGTVWANDAARAGTRGAYAGQLGVQVDNSAIYIAGSTAPGDWTPFLRFDGIVTSVDGVPGSKPNPEGDIVGTIESQTLYNKTLQTPLILDPVGLNADDVGLGNVSNVPDNEKPPSDQVMTLLAGKQNTGEKGFANGYASLDGSTKVPLSQLPDVMLGASAYKGTWNATTNTPVIPTAAAGNTGWYYIVSTAGTTNINGTASWAVGDTIISNGTIWQKVTSTSAVTSVAGKTGTVTLVKGDVGLSAVDNTSDAQKNSAAATLTNKTIAGASNNLDVRLGTSDVSGNLPVTHLASGTGAAPNTWWCGDGTWKQPAGTGDVTGTTVSVDGEVALFSGTGGKIIKRATGTGIVSVSSGVYQPPLPLTSLAPVASILDYAGLAEPPGWMFCDGRSLIQADYSALYTAIGTQFGTGGEPVVVSEKGVATTGGTSITATGVTPAGSNRLLLVWVFTYVAGDIAITGITFNGVALTRHLEWALHTAMSIGEFSLWYMVNPPAVTANVVATFNKAAQYSTMDVQVFNGVNQTTPLGTAVATPLTTTGSTATYVNVPSAVGDLVIDCLPWWVPGYYQAGGTVGNYTPRWDQVEYAMVEGASSGLAGFHCSRMKATGTTTRMIWSRENSEASMMGVAVKGLGIPSFSLPDLRGYVTAGRNDIGVSGSNRLQAFYRKADTNGTDQYLRTITPDLGKGGVQISTAMLVEGPGIPPETYVYDLYDTTTLQLTEITTSVNTQATYKFSFLDGTKVGSRSGNQSHWLSVYEMPAHSHAINIAFFVGAPGFASGPNLNTGAGGTGNAGGNRSHANLQPTTIMNKIIKY